MSLDVTPRDSRSYAGDRYRAVARLFGIDELHVTFRNLYEKWRRVKRDVALEQLLSELISAPVQRRPVALKFPMDIRGEPSQAGPSTGVFTARLKATTTSERSLKRALSRLTGEYTSLAREHEEMKKEHLADGQRIKDVLSQERVRVVELEKQLRCVKASSALEAQIAAAELWACERKLRTATRMNADASSRAMKLLDGIKRRHAVNLSATKRQFDAALHAALDDGKRNLAEAVEEVAAERTLRQRVESDLLAAAATTTATTTAAADLAASMAATAVAAELTLHACVAACMEAAATQAATQVEAVTEASAAAARARELLAEGYAGFKVWYRQDWHREEAAALGGAALSPSKKCMLGITSHYMKRGEQRDVPRSTVLDGGRGSKGASSFLIKASAARKGSAAASQRTKRVRNLEMNKSVERISARPDAPSEETAADVHAQWKDHIRANTDLYKKLGKSFEVVMDVEATCTLCNDSSGLLIAAYRRHLKKLGVKVASKAAVRAHHQQYHHPSVSAKVTQPDPKRPGKTTVAAWLRIVSLEGVMQSVVNNKARSGDLLWRENIPGDEIWWQLVVDKGGTATKLVLKCCCDSMPDSVRHVVLLGIFDRISDKYDMVATAFGPVYEQMNVINFQGGCVWAPWFQHARQCVVLREHDFYPERIDHTLTSAITAPIVKGSAADIAAAAASGPEVTSAARAASLASRRQAAAGAAQARIDARRAAPLALWMADNPEDAEEVRRCHNLTPPLPVISRDPMLAMPSCRHTRPSPPTHCEPGTAMWPIVPTSVRLFPGSWQGS